MNFKLKTLAVALALAACAGQASAKVALPTATTPSDAIFFAIDQSSGSSFTYDLGSFANLSITTDVTSNSAWTDFLAAEGGSLDNVTWGVLSNQGNNVATSQFFTTVTSGQTIGSETGIKMSGGRVALNNFFNTTTLTTAGTSAFTNAASYANVTTSLKNSWSGNAAGWTTDNLVGDVADFYSVTAATSAAGGTLLLSGLTFNGTTLSVVAVPEPESYAMLLAGLGLLGFMARRRKA